MSRASLPSSVNSHLRFSPTPPHRKGYHIQAQFPRDPRLIACLYFLRARLPAYRNSDPDTVTPSAQMRDPPARRSCASIVHAKVCPLLHTSFPLSCPPQFVSCIHFLSLGCSIKLYSCTDYIPACIHVSYPTVAAACIFRVLLAIVLIFNDARRAFEIF